MSAKPCPTKGCVGLIGHPGTCATLGVFAVEVVEWVARRIWKRVKGAS